MRIAFILYDGMAALEFVGVYDPLTRLKQEGIKPDLEWDTCALSAKVQDMTGLQFIPGIIGQSLSIYDLIIVPGGPGSRNLIKEGVRSPSFIAWLQTAQSVPLKASTGNGALLLGAAGFLKGKAATTDPDAFSELKPYCGRVLPQLLVDSGDVITAGGINAAQDLGLYLVEKLAANEVNEEIHVPMGYSPDPRKANLERYTAETRVTVDLNLDGTGQHSIDTGIGFLDHMLTQLAVHGLFDLKIKAIGDLHVDVHHTVEDVALALGQAFGQALGERKGIVRIASAYVPMDEALAFVAIDFSGRPYALIEADWHSPAVGFVPTSLFPHFLESFATAARCNLHARILNGRDDHHQAEALFKAMARALDEATCTDPRRFGTIPSSKGTLTT
jgi:imidazoleglycerol-phosphate dehydratase